MKFRLKYFYRLPLWLFTLTVAGSVSAQKQVAHQGLYFLRYDGRYRLSPQWGATLEVEDRRFFSKNRNVNWVLPRVAITRSLGSGWSAAAGFTYYLADNPADPDKAVAVRVPELRPHEELSLKQNAGRLLITHRYRLEERFIRKTQDDHLAPGYSFNFRMRYQLQFAYPLIKTDGPSGAVQVKAADEVMFNLGHQIARNTFDQNRLYVALNYGISRNVQAELGYLKWFQQRSSGDQFYSRDIARLTIFHTVNFQH